MAPDLEVAPDPVGGPDRAGTSHVGAGPGGGTGGVAAEAGGDHGPSPAASGREGHPAETEISGQPETWGVGLVPEQGAPAHEPCGWRAGSRASLDGDSGQV